MSKVEIRHFKSLLREGSLRHMNILLDDKFQSELLNIIKDYELLVKENQKQKEVIDKAIEYIETCNPNVELHSEFLNESYLSNYGAKELLDILKEVSK